mmetsp:Transcript_78994/g.92344  ORF Transcript_78994/g.92344 Transcript_78994/m.92344 type:complete len:253 (+) Transcript_78994:46-804(+)|eukprot:CAMPEP_0176431762 /NCGR_PEP_ID=MMETSP0127-20121128/14993_1 /TAXON_ID=938130 /ORGANISM="Platyophrya macrostoma, Strain WH" /LENGTH=252 /DNA_ID=CAMNT_0017813807 /DNA_START=45 /DNA_END=803 /DNA_ORIENTATION=+
MAIDSRECQKESLCFFPEYNQLVSLEAIVCGHVAYLVITFGLRALMKNRAPMGLKSAMLFYNALQVFLSVLMTIKLAPFLANNIFNISGNFHPQIEFWVLVHYVTKYLDMFDSIFMVLRKKGDQLSFLHVYHHMTIGAIWGLLLHFGVGNGAAFFGAWINSLVHALMYFHYLWTSLGFKNPLKPYLTMFQMFQFSLCILQAVLAVAFDTQIPRGWCVLQLCYHMTLLYLFLQFFRGDQKKRKTSPKVTEKKE